MKFLENEDSRPQSQRARSCGPGICILTHLTGECALRFGSLWSGGSSKQRAMRCVRNHAKFFFKNGPSVDLLSSLYTLHAARLEAHLYPSIVCEGSPFLNLRHMPVLVHFTDAATEAQNVPVAGKAHWTWRCGLLSSFGIRKRPAPVSKPHPQRACLPGIFQGHGTLRHWKQRPKVC